MPDTPTENTLTVNATHHMLGDLEEEFTGPAALSPNRRMENILGYDTNLPLLKSASARNADRTGCTRLIGRPCSAVTLTDGVDELIRGKQAFEEIYDNSSS